MITRTRRFLLVPVLAAFVLGLAGAAHASPGAATAVLVDDDDRAYNAAQLGLRECDGGAQLSVHMRSSDTEVSIGENGAFVPLPGATYAFQVPNMATALVDVTFSAEGSLVGEQIPNLPPADFLQVVILLDGVWMHPDNDLAFSSQTYRADATQTCRRVGPGNHVVTVVWQLVDQGMANVLTGVLDDYELKVQLHA